MNSQIIKKDKILKPEEREGKGYITIAQNNKNTDYIKLAYVLAMSLKATQIAMYSPSKLSIVVTDENEVPQRYRWAFDKIIEMPWGDNAENSNWKLENEWKIFHITPYQETVKLDCDMLFLSDVGEWWNLFTKRDVVAPTQVFNCQNQLTNNNYYRSGFKENGVPTIHTAFMYFKNSNLALDWFTMAEIITFNWEKFYWEYMPIDSPKEFSTDTTFSLAAKLIDEVENIISPWPEIPSFVHAKTGINPWIKSFSSEDWSDHVQFNFTPKLECFIGPYRILKPLHYHLKHLITDEIIYFYEKALGKHA